MRALSILLAGLLACSHLSAITIEPDGPEQAPLIFVHGFIDDGTGWARNALTQAEETFSPLSIKYLRHYHFGPTRSPSKLFTEQGVDNWAVQWWSRDGGNPYANADEGYAFLQTAEELLAGTDWIKGTWSAQNRPIPSALDILTSREIDIAIQFLPVPGSFFGVGTNVIAKVALASQLIINNNYQDAGRVDPRAEDFLELLREERKPNGRLGNTRQVNIITHSMGSLVARATLDKAFNASQQDSEFVANVIYNAPPFGGSTMAYLAKIYFEPADITSDIFNDERFALMLGTSATTHKDLIVNLMDLYMRPIGLEFSDVESSLPLAVRNAIDFLLLFPINVPVNPDFIQSLSGTVTGNILAEAMQTIRPFVAGLTGMAGAPGYNDLTPEGGVNHLNLYTTNPDVAQFVTLGNQGFGVHLFPDDLTDVANDPTLIANNAELSAQADDTAVAVGSAKLLTQTDAFGPRMTLLGELDLEHPDLLYRHTEVMAPIWLETFLVPPTRLEITGDMVPINSNRRSYFSASGDSDIQFLSTPETRTVEFSLIDYLPLQPDQQVSIRADHHEYRVVSDDGTETLVDWQQAAYRTSISLSDLVDDNNLGDTPFYFEWRSVNENGGKEIIRSARFVVAGAAPQVIDFAILGGASNEVHQNSRALTTGVRSVRTGTLSELSVDTSATLLASIALNPEASWVLSRPANKALTLAFDQTASIRYQFGDATLSSPTTASNVNGQLIELSALSEGIHSFYYQLSKTVAGQTVSSPIHRLNIQVDNTAPFIAFDLIDNHALGVVVGPTTPLSFSIQDVGVNAGTGELRVAGNSNWAFPQNTVFTLQDTGLVEQMRQNNIDGGFTTLNLTAKDFLQNSATLVKEIYVDVTAPDFSIEAITPVSLLSTNRYQTFANSIDLVINVSDAGAGTTADLPELAIADEFGDIHITNALTRGGIGGYPDHYGINVPLSLGENYIAISMRDIAGNIGTFSFSVNYLEALSDVSPIESMTPRLERTTCFNGSTGNEKTCTVGNIDRFAIAYDGETIAFESGGERFVEGDQNGEDDIFVWQRNQLSLISVNEQGIQGNEPAIRPAISGNGRYVVFESNADNLLSGATGYNLFLKDTETGELSVISLGTDDLPINRNFPAEFSSSLTYSGRYVFFSSNSATYLSEFPNPGEQVYMVDLDPDEDGNFFNGNYVTHPISNLNASSMPANTSRYPKVTQDGQYVVYHSQTDGALKLVRFSGTDQDGNLNTDARAEVLLPNSSVFDISPYGDNVAFSTTANLLPQDDNTEFVNSDVYLSTGESNGGNFTSRSLSLISGSISGGESAMNTSLPLQDVSVSRDSPSNTTDVKVAWVSSHTNIVTDDNNAVEDLFVNRSSTVFPSTLPVPNWISDSVSSTATILTGALSPDGRFAYFLTQQSYNSPYAADGERHLYRRRIDEVSSHQLTLDITGNGTVNVNPAGVSLGNGVYEFDDEPQLLLSAVADSGSMFVGWNSDLSLTSPAHSFWLNEDQTITAEFSLAPTPISATLDISVKQNSRSFPTEPTIVFTGEQLFSLRLETSPKKGSVVIKGNNAIYTPDRNETGVDTFTFNVVNQYGVGLPSPATATVTIEQTNQPPTSVNLTIETTKNTASAATQPDVNDIDDSTFQYQVLQAPASGVVTQTASGFVYTPVSAFLGDDSFTLRATDSAGQSVLGIALVTVTEAVPEPTKDNKPTTKKKGGSVPLWLSLLTILLIVKRFRGYP
jgi:hypothetical protein